MTITKEKYAPIIESVYFDHPRQNSKSAFRDILDTKTAGELDCTQLDILLDMLLSRINNPQHGECFFVKHQRKGEFIARFDDVGDEWITGTIISGTAKAVLDYNVKYEGEQVTMRRSLMWYYPIKDVTNPKYIKLARGVDNEQ